MVKNLGRTLSPETCAMKKPAIRITVALCVLLSVGCDSGRSSAPLANPTPPNQVIATSIAPSPTQLLHEQQITAETLKRSVMDTNSIGMKLVLIPAGEFLMGSPTSEVGRSDDERPQHLVRITQPFDLSVYEVTVGQFRQFVEAVGYRTEAERDRLGGSGFTNKKWEWKHGFSWQDIGIPQSEAYPVVNVSWNDAVAFCQWLSEKEHRTYRLPTEAEWEYACRAGTTTPFHWGSTLSGMEGNCRGLAPYGTTSYGPYLMRPTKVGSYTGNAFGLYDMHGNVWEWCEDECASEYDTTSRTGDVNFFVGPSRVRRGGGWSDPAVGCRSASRRGNSPDICAFCLGFRVAATLSTSTSLIQVDREKKMAAEETPSPAVVREAG